MPNSMPDFQRGYAQALADINRPMCVVAEKWNPFECPRCGRLFFDGYENYDDGYYWRARELERCPYCGQKLDWSVVDEFPTAVWVQS